mgnify:FL=1
MHFTLKKYSASALLAALLLIFVSSCEDAGQDSLLQVSVRTENVPASSGSQFVSVAASGDWTLSIAYDGSQSDWASLSTESGSGSKSNVILNYSANDKDEPRSLTIVLKEGKRETSCSLTQTGKDGSTGGDGGTGSGGDNPGGNDTPVALPGWMELPEMNQADGLRFVAHDMTLSGAKVRNYSMAWDKENLVAHWVAYPLNSGLIGKGGRTDEWGYDPKVPRDEQPRYDKGIRGYDRGHQIPSADRLEYNANVKTFYFTNMTPQLGSRFNQSIWADIEGRVRGIAKTSDTLYVVTGCVVKGSTKVAYDNDGREVTVPTAYFKALLKYNKASTTGIGGYSAAAYYLEHKSYSSKNPDASMICSISELEAKTGINFFANLAGKVGEANALRIESEKPVASQWM